MVLTANGSKPFAGLARGVHQVLTTDGVWAEASVERCHRQQLFRLTLSRNKVIKVLHVAPGHRWLLRTSTANGNPLGRRRPECATCELLPGDRLAFVYPKREAALAVDAEGVARGFVFGDGSSSPHSSIANFCGVKDEQLLRFFVGRREPRVYGGVARVTGLPREWKTEYPSLEDEVSYLYGWLAGYFAADGDVGKTGRPTLTSARRDHLEFVKVLCTRIGVGTFGIRERYGGSFGGPDSRLYLMGIMRRDLEGEFFLNAAHRERYLDGRCAWERRGWTVRSVEDVGLTGDGFCFASDAVRGFVLDANVLTANCAFACSVL